MKLAILYQLYHTVVLQNCKTFLIFRSSQSVGLRQTAAGNFEILRLFFHPGFLVGGVIYFNYYDEQCKINLYCLKLRHDDW